MGIGGHASRMRFHHSTRKLILWSGLPIILALAVLLTGVFNTLMIINGGERIDAIDRRTLNWNLFQTHLQFQTFSHTLETYDLGDEGKTTEEIIQRFELAWSRLPIFTSDEISSSLQTRFELSALEAMLTGYFESIEQLVYRYDQINSEEKSFVRSTFSTAYDLIKDKSSDVYHYNLQAGSSERETLEGYVQKIMLLICGIILSALAILGVLFFSLSRTVKSLNSTENARLDAETARSDLRSVIDAIPALVTAQRPDGSFAFINKACHQFYDVDEADGDRIDALAARLKSRMAPVANQRGYTKAHELTETDASGETRTLLNRQVPIYTSEDVMRYLVSVSIDITDRKIAEQNVRRLAGRDPLTGLANRLTFNDKLSELLSYCHSNAGKFAIHILDLDKFKDINDKYGHDVGDAVLVAIVGRVRSQLRRQDLMARLGGDEFAIVQTLIDSTADAETLATRISKNLAEPLTASGIQIPVSSSIGIATYPTDGCEIDTLYKHADLAAYASKQNGGRCHSVFHPDMAEDSLRRREIEQEIREGLEKDEFDVFFQPKYWMSTGKLASLEALMRWHHPEKGMISPGLFIPVAEETGLIVELGMRALQKTLNHLKQMKTFLPDDVHAAVNLSPRQFHAPNLIESIENMLQETGIETHNITLELTESTLIEDAESAQQILGRLRSLGIRISLDDFGTGYSSLSYLQDHQFDMLKIDRSFVSPLGTDAGRVDLVRAIVDMAHSLSMDVVAEGIETIDQYRILEDLGCDIGQGFLMSRPLPANLIHPGLFSYNPDSDEKMKYDAA